MNYRGDKFVPKFDLWDYRYLQIKINWDWCIYISVVIKFWWLGTANWLTNRFCSHFKFDGNFALLWFHCWSSDRNKYLHIPRQHSCRVMYKLCRDRFIRIELSETKYLSNLKYDGQTTVIRAPAGGRLNKKDGLTRYGDSHVKDKTS